MSILPRTKCVNYQTCFQSPVPYLGEGVSMMSYWSHVVSSAPDRWSTVSELAPRAGRCRVCFLSLVTCSKSDCWIFIFFRLSPLPRICMFDHFPRARPTGSTAWHCQCELKKALSSKCSCYPIYRVFERHLKGLNRIDPIHLPSSCKL